SRLIEEAIAQGADAIAVNCNDPGGCIDPIKAAIEAGIPVMTWNSDSPDSGRFTYLGVSNYEGGKAAADLLIREMGTSGRVALLTGVPGAFNLEERIRGFKDGIAGTDIEIVATVACNDDMNLGVQMVEETMLANPELDGWFFAGEWPIMAGNGAMPLFEEAALNGDLKVVAFDTLPIELEWLKDGRLDGLIGQRYWGWGYDTVFMALNHVGFLYPYPDWTDSGMDIVTINNVDAMTDGWESHDFTQPLPPPY
ncbi:MAG: sugar ABC transporter substrate-binding protein, partial [Chloroflexi bacterium]